MTLVETTIALVILAVGLLAMLAVQIQALNQGNQGRHSTEAAQIARDQMEMLQRLPWTHAAVAPGANWQPPRNVALIVQSPAGNAQEQVFALDWRVTQNALDPNLRMIDVRVTWAENGANAAAGNRSHAMSSVKFKDPWR